MAYITGVLIIVVCFVGIPLQVAEHHSGSPSTSAWCTAGCTSSTSSSRTSSSQKLKMKAGPTVLLLLAGTIPVMTFFVERWMQRAYIAPALAAESAPPSQQPVSR